MSKQATHSRALRRRRLSLGLRALPGLVVVAALAVTQGSVPATTAGSEGRSAPQVVAANRDGTVGASRDQDREQVASTRPYKVQEGFEFVLKPEVLEARQRALEPVVFRVSTFNVLGAGHTTAGGNKPGWASGATRMRWAIDLLRGAGVDVVGFQEFQRPQFAVFNNSMPNWGVYPGAQLRRRGATANSIAWDEGKWERVEAHTIDIPYFGGKPWPMPYVLLRDRYSGQEVWFANFHNPADVHGPAERHRNRATALQISLANNLHADGTPVIITGDMNDKADYFCPMTARAPMHAANGGSTGGGCSPPSNMGIDWIFGSTDVDFANYVRNDGPLVNRTTDHPYIWTQATLN